LKQKDILDFWKYVEEVVPNGKDYIIKEILTNDAGGNGKKSRNVLQGSSLSGLLALMEKVGVSKITHASSWYLDRTGNFNNDMRKIQGNIYKLIQDGKMLGTEIISEGVIFSKKNPDPTFNPYFYQSLITKDLEDQIKRETEQLEKDTKDMEEGEDKDRVVKSRVGHGKFKKGLIEKLKTNGFVKCALCPVSNEALLIASHIKPWRVSDGKEKINVHNGLLLCPNHDKLFDRGYISFDEKGHIMISSLLNEINQKFMNVFPKQKIDLSDAEHEFMIYHREVIFEDQKISVEV
jgi:hypothetical protein